MTTENENRRHEFIDEMQRLYKQRSYSDQELAVRLGTDRTNVFRIRKYMEEQMGIPIEPDVNKRGRYFIPKEYIINHIPLNRIEAAQLYLAGRRLQQQTRTSQRPVASALEKLALALNKPLAEQMVRAAEVVLTQEQDHQQESIFATLVECWLDSIPVRITHRKLHGEARTYRVHPYQLEPSVWGDGIYLIGHSEYHGKLATFKLARIEKAVKGTGMFAIPDDFDIHELLQHAWGIWHADAASETVVLRFSPYVTPRVRETLWHPQQTLVIHDDGSSEWSAPVAEPQEMLPWIRGWGADCEVVGPVWLQKRLEKEARKLAALYGVSDLNTPRTRFFAHRRDGEDKEFWQPLIDHLTKTAEMARDFGADANIAELAYIAGMIHDLGKYSAEFQKRLEGGSRVDHSTAGAKELKKLLEGRPQQVFAQLLAYPIMGHHTGLPDFGSETDLEGGTICGRLKNNIPNYSEYKSELDLSALSFPKHLSVRPLRLPIIPDKPPKDYVGFSLSFLTRMIYSALVDADFQETETYMKGAKPRGGHEDIPTLREKLDAHLKQFENPTSDINRKRNEILHACIENGKVEKPGFFSLTVPTGGGKTLASMAFALHHAVEHGLKRIIYVIPFTTIIEQNAKVFKSIFGEENVLEHHSNFDWEGKKREDADNRTNSVLAKLKLAAENWDIPIVVTTNVQFFESLFANKSSRCRKLHNIAKSVIIFDEAQMLPREYMRPAMATVWELVTNYGASAVFCTATQPGLERFLPEKTEVKELAPNPPELFDFYKRVEVKHLGTLADEDLLARLNAHEQALCIVNTRRHASGLFGGLHGGEGNYHLSTLMCPAHRRAKLSEIEARLKSEQSCRVVSTTVMEAGIDLDFPVGYRALSGLDSINQAAGRVNREMKRGVAEMFVFEPKSEFVRRMPSFLKQAVEVARMVLRDHADAPISIPAIQAFFGQLYNLQDPQAFDFKRIMECFDSADGRFQFETAARAFQIIEDPTVTVLIPYNEEAKRLIEELKYTDYPFSTLRKLQPYTVSIFEGEFGKLSSKGAVLTIHDTYHFLNPDSMQEYYDPNRGLLVPDSHGGDGLFA